jgi:hypothetical protein
VLQGATFVNMQGTCMMAQLLQSRGLHICSVCSYLYIPLTANVEIAHILCSDSDLRMCS